MPISKIKTSSITADAASVNLNIDANTLFLDVANNRVGVGTTSPYRQFQIGNYSTSAIMALGSSAASTGTIAFATSDNAPDRYVGTIGYNHQTNAMTFGVNAVDAMRIDSSGNLLLGTTTLPGGRKFIIEASGDTVGRMNSAGASNGISLEFANNGTLRGGIGNGSGNITSGNAADIGIQANANLIFATGGYAERMRIDSVGNLGIGTSSPNFKAHISTGSTASITQPTAGSYGLYIQQNTSGSVGGIYIQDGASNSGNSLFIADNNGVGRLVVDGDGNTIIGDTAPQYSARLYVNGAVAARNGGVDGTFQNAFVAGYTSNYTEKNIIQTAVSTAATGSGFRFQVSNGAGSAGVTTALDVTRSQIISHIGMVATSGQVQTGTVTTDGSGNAQIQVSGWAWNDFNSYRRNIFAMLGIQGVTYLGTWAGVIQWAVSSSAIGTTSTNASGSAGTITFATNGTTGQRWFQLSGVPANSTFNYTIRGFALTEDFRSNYGAF